MAQALNSIDVVLSEKIAVVAIWYKYYALLSQSPD